MTREEIIWQLESLIDYSKGFIRKDNTEDIWYKDFIALNYAIDLIKKESTAPQQVDPKENIQ